MHARHLVRFTLMMLLVSAHAARAQFDASIDEHTLRTPWDLHLAVMRDLSAGPEPAVPRPGGNHIDRLTLLQVALGEYESQVDELIDRVSFDTQFGYIAAQTSLALAKQLEEIERALDAVYESLGCREREDVAQAQLALRRLRDLLALASPFERDVVNALGSGFRQTRVDLAMRWWKGAAQASELRKLVALMRERLELGIDRKG